MNNTIKRIKILLTVCVTLIAASLLALLIFWLTPLREQFEDDQAAQLSILSTHQKDGYVTVETTYGAFRYPDAVADLITVKAQNGKDSADLDFFATVQSGELSLFTIHYGGEEGIPCGTFAPTKGSKVTVVYVTFADPPADLSADEKAAFLEAQEVFNDVISSMNEDARFEGL